MQSRERIAVFISNISIVAVIFCLLIVTGCHNTRTSSTSSTSPAATPNIDSTPINAPVNTPVNTSAGSIATTGQLAAGDAANPVAAAVFPHENNWLSAPVDFYGKRIGNLKLFGQPRWGETSPGQITANKIYHAAGVLVDNNAQPNHIYVADTGNNRILGFYSYNSKKADIIIGQPNETSGACNGDNNVGMYGPATRSSLCLTGFPMGTNVAEQWMRINFDVDKEGNLYVIDFYNNRILMYRAPFSQDKTNGKGDNIADMVWGQDDFNGNGINRGQGEKTRDARSLYLSFGGFDHVSARGVSVDSKGNLWVADTFNFRVLRFPKGQTTADLVLGQPNFTDSQPACQVAKQISDVPLDRMCSPTLARINPETNELYVVDEYPGGFPARILIFAPPFTNGMAARGTIVPRQPLTGDFAKGYRLTHATGLVFNTYKSDEWIDETRQHRYREGIFWLHDGQGSRTLLLDAEGNILLAIGATAIDRNGRNSATYQDCGEAPEQPFNLAWPGGMIGLDSDHNIYLADEHWHRIARFALPYRIVKQGQKSCLPAANGGLFPGAYPNSVGPAKFSEGVGTTAYRGQLIVRDRQRYLVWNNYLARENGIAADFVVGQVNGTDTSQHNHIVGRAMHAIDRKERLWTTGEHGKLIAYQLPLMAGSQPIRELIPLYWADEPEHEVDYRCDQPLAYDRLTNKLWIYDTIHHRLLRIKNPDDIAGKLLVDAVIGQLNKTDGALNRGMVKPDAASFGDVNDIRFDRQGNLFVVDNTYEGHPNGRIIGFSASDLAAIDRLFTPIKARFLYVTETFDQTSIIRIHDPIDRPFSPVSVAFNSHNEMVVANDGYYRNPRMRAITQLYLFRDPLKKNTPDAVIELPLGAPGEISFDEGDNLIVQDHTWCKVWVINYQRDPSWLRAIR